MNGFLDSPEFQELLDDPKFLSDLKGACQWVLYRYQDSNNPSLEELSQEVLIRFGKWLNQYRREANYQTVLQKIATNILIDESRRRNAKRRWHQEVDLTTFDLESVRGPSGNQIEFEILRTECVDKLPPKDRQIFIQYHDEGRSLREIAAELGISVPSMSQRWSRIVKKLARCMRGGFPTS